MAEGVFSRSAVVLLDKMPGLTSFSALDPLKRIAGAKCGHGGTLDRFASGLLVAFSGRLTGLCPLFSGLPKVYEALVEFGSETSTLDPEGEVVGTAPPPGLSEIEKALPGFRGATMQTPPSYSAIHIQGRRAWRLARGGQAPKMAPRPVFLSGYEILGYDKPFLSIRLRVSKGFYVRSFARDLGLGCSSRAHLASLRRTAIGPYLVSEAASCSDLPALEDRVARCDPAKLLLRLEGASVFELEDGEEAGLLNGALPKRFFDRPGACPRAAAAPVAGPSSGAGAAEGAKGAVVAGADLGAPDRAGGGGGHGEFCLVCQGGRLRAVVDAGGRFLARGL